MKTIFKNLGLGILVAGCIAVTGTRAFAQDAPAADVCKDIEGQQATYKVFTDNYVKGATLEQRKTAVKAGEDYVQKYGACPESKQIIDYMNTNLPKIKAGIEKDEGIKVKGAVLTKFDTAAKGKNVPDIFASGKEILSKEADYPEVALDVALTLTSAGFDQALATPPVETYNADTINFAKNAIQKIEAGKTSTSWGVWTYNFKPAPANEAKFKDLKAYTLGALNYIIGNINYFHLGKTDPTKKKEALSYFYKATQYDSFTKTDPSIYQAIGAWYLDEAIKIDKERQAILAAMPEKERKDNEQTLAMVGMQKGYADRAIDAYARAYKLSKDDKTSKPGVADGLYDTLKKIYAFRFDNKIDGIDDYVASVQTKPLPDPTIAITPVAVEPTTDPANPTPTDTTKPATDTMTKPATTTTPATNTTKPATINTTPTTPKPATTPTTPPKKPVSTTNAKSSSSTNVSETEKSNVKKPAPKKKGTR